MERTAEEERMAAEEIAAARRAANERQQALEIIGGALDVLMPDFRASGSSVEYAAKVAAELGRRFGKKDGEERISVDRLDFETFRMRWNQLPPLVRGAYAYALVQERIVSISRRGRAESATGLSNRRVRVNEQWLIADRLVAGLMVTLMHEGDADADKLLPYPEAL